jgi:hypothetical protein
MSQWSPSGSARNGTLKKIFFCSGNCGGRLTLGSSPHGFTPEEFNDSTSPLVHEIKKTGVKVF